MDTLDKHFAPAVAPPSDPKELASPNWGGRLGALLPAHLDVASPKMLQGEYTFGGLADSYYEYLVRLAASLRLPSPGAGPLTPLYTLTPQIKQAQLTSFALEQYPRMYRDAVDSAYEHLIRPVDVVPGREDLTLVGSVNLGKWQPSLQHLTCFAGGMCVLSLSLPLPLRSLTRSTPPLSPPPPARRLGLGARLLNRPHDLDTAINVTNACAWTYESSKTGIGGENTVFYEAESPSRYMVLDRPDSKGK